MKACNVKKADTFLVTRIPSWKLFLRLVHLCIKRAIMGKIPLQGISVISSSASESSTSSRETANHNLFSQPITESSNPNLARALQRLIPFQTVNSLPSRNWINASFSRPSKAPAKRLIQVNRSQKITWLKNILELLLSRACRPNWRWWSSAISYYNGLQWRDIDLFFNIF